MPLESFQCPSCASPQFVESAAKSCTCTYCGVQLTLARGSSGHILGVPAHPPVAGLPHATRVAVEHLEERVQALLAQKDGLEGERQREIEEAVAHYAGLRQVRNWVVIGSVLVAVIGSLFQPWLAANLLVTVAALLAWPFIDRRRARDEQQAQRVAALKYEPAFASIEAEIEQTREQIALLSRGVDGPAKT